jgi:hypothetical protein
LYKEPFSIGIPKISSFFTDIGYLVVIIGTNLFGYVAITRTLYTPSLTIVKNCDTMLAIPP